MKSNLAATESILNMNLLLASASRDMEPSDPKVSGPTGLVANWSCTRLYRKASWRGRIWQFIRWVTRTDNNALKQTIMKASQVVRETVENMQKLVKEAGKPGALGDYWKTGTVNVVRSDVCQAIKLQGALDEISQIGLHNLTKAVAWANGTSQEKAYDEPTAEAINQLASAEIVQGLHVAEYKTAKAEYLVKRLKEMGDICSIEVLCRELLSNYPRTDEELQQRRDELQERTLGCKPTNSNGDEEPCPARLIYAPLVAVARDFANRKSLSLGELKIFLDDLMMPSSSNEIHHNGGLLLEIIKYLRDPDNATTPNIPSSVLKSLRDNRWVQTCRIHKTAASSLIRYTPGQHTEYEFEHQYDYWPSLNGMGPERIHYASWHIPYTVYTVHKSYYLFDKWQDGTERIEVHHKQETLSKVADMSRVKRIPAFFPSTHSH